MVQNMIASKYLATYEEQVMYWRKSLANVADVMMIFQEIQRTWAYLEVLFMGSEVRASVIVTLTVLPVLSCMCSCSCICVVDAD